MLYSDVGTSIKSTRKGTGKKSIVSHTELKRILRHSSYSDADPSEFMESNGSRQMAGGFEISEIDETSKENFDTEQSAAAYRQSACGFKGSRRRTSRPIGGAGDDGTLAEQTQEWHVPVIEDTIEEEEEFAVSPTRLVRRDEDEASELCDGVGEETQQQEKPVDPHAVVEKASLIFHEVVESAADEAGTDDLQDVSDLLEKTIEEIGSEGAGVSELAVAVLRNDLRRRTAAVRRKIEIAKMQEIEMRKRVALRARERILADVESLGGWSEDVEEIFRERCKSAVVESKTPTGSMALRPSGAREELLRYWQEIIDRFALEGQLAMGHKKREELRAECSLQDARVSLAEQEARAADIVRKYGRLIIDSSIEAAGEDGDYADLLLKTVADGYISRKCTELQEKEERDLKNLAKLMESRDAVVKEKKELEEKVSAQRRVSNWNKCWAYWTAVLRGYRELPSDQLGARKFETASGLMAIVLEEGDPDVRVHGSTSGRDVSLPNGKFGCAWDAIAARGKALLLAGATAEEVMQSIVKMGDRVGRLQESARLLRDEGRLGSCSLVVCTDRGKLALLHQVDVPRGFGAR
ncbi:hypothetical protein FOZ63_031136, partial [Perkinsus olseni]